MAEGSSGARSVAEYAGPVRRAGRAWPSPLHPLEPRVTSRADSPVPFTFTINARCPHTRARCGCFHTPHGAVHTPRFMPVGTAATVKGVSTSQLAETGAQMVLANTYHLHLQPGEAVVAEAEIGRAHV